jgi:hypothetical protein
MSPAAICCPSAVARAIGAAANGRKDEGSTPSTSVGLPSTFTLAASACSVADTPASRPIARTAPVGSGVGPAISTSSCCSRRTGAMVCRRLRAACTVASPAACLTGVESALAGADAQLLAYLVSCAVAWEGAGDRAGAWWPAVIARTTPVAAGIARTARGHDRGRLGLGRRPAVASAREVAGARCAYSGAALPDRPNHSLVNALNNTGQVRRRPWQVAFAALIQSVWCMNGKRTELSIS